VVDVDRELPGSILFACTHNAIRSPIAEVLMKHLHGRRVFVDSAGVRPTEIDPFAVAVVDEMGLDLSKHRAKGFDDLENDYFDLVISFAPEAHHRAVELTRTSSCEIEFWPTMNPSIVEGSREVRLDAYREVRDQLLNQLRRRFPPRGAPVMA
jgi:protein-tyrosine-phosphatase